MACSAQIELHTGGDVAHNTPASPVAVGPRVSLHQLGARLFMAVLQVDLPAGTSGGTTFSYDVGIHEGTTRRGLFQLGLLGGTAAAVGAEFDARRSEVPLGYAEGRLPSFVTPVDHASALRFVHASCRKPHGGGKDEPEGMELVDAHLADVEAGRLAEGERVQQLILTGDQIYADDVAPGLLAALTEAGRELLGWDEPIPGIVPAVSFMLDPGWRTRFLSMSDIELKEIPEDGATDYSGSHLLRFGEWCAMYLFAWSDALWGIDSHGNYDLPDKPTLLPLAHFESLVSAAETVGAITVSPVVSRALAEASRLLEFAEQLNEVWDETREKALGYAHSVRAVRRALANVATYTMFDDHEITDDWFLSRRVHDRLKGTSSSGPRAEVGPRLLRNGLSAYAFFQHWGNVPDDFDAGRQGADLLDKWRVAGSTARLRTHPREADTLLGVVGGDSPIPASRRRDDFVRMRWDYAIEFPAHRLVALDTRTWRFFPTSDPFTWSSLAPLIPGPPGTANASGAAQVAAVVAAWRAAGTASGQVVMSAFADVVDAYVALAADVHGARGTVETRYRTLVLALDALIDQIPGRTTLAASAVVDPIDAFLREIFDNPATITSMFAALSDSELSETIVRSLHDAADFDFGPASDALTLTFRALADFVDMAVSRSGPGMAFAARRAVAASTGVWSVITSLPASHPANAQLIAAIQLALAGLDTLTTTIGVDRLARAIFREGGNRLGPGLIRDDALEFMVTAVVPRAHDDPGNAKLTLLLSPAPIFGNRLVEVAQRVKVVQLIAQGKAGEEELDYEAWSCNLPSMLQFFEAARGLACAIVLSGDVHYAGSSVNHVTSTLASTQYLQLTSSSARNSDGMTRGLARLDDLVYDDEGQIFLVQTDWTALMDSSASSLPHLRNLARARLDDILEDLGNAVDARRQWENFRRWWSSSTITLEDVLETGEAVVMAVPNTARAIVTEAAWEIYSAIELIQELSDDPLLAMFGDFLTAGPALRQHLRDFYREVGLDPALGLRVASTTIVDRRAARVAPYPAARRVAAGSAAAALREDFQRRTVGYANAGFVTLRTRGDQVVEVAHELRWYPDDEPEHGQNPVTRTDWTGTLHRLGWLGVAADVARSTAATP
jgi:hypothetical protein